MEIRTRAFPHPVLAPESGDFTEGEVKLSEATAQSAPERYTIEFNFALTNSDLLGLVGGGEASMAVVIECKQNLYRRRHPVVLGANTIVIPADELRGQVQVTPVVSATKDLENYSLSSFNADYKGLAIIVPKHGLLAFGSNLEFIAEPKADRLRNISSIMRVCQTDEPGDFMRVNLGGEKIRVEVPAIQFRRYQSVAVSHQGAAILASMLVLPVLIDVFYRVKEGERSEWEEFRWYQVLKLRLGQLDRDLESDDLSPLDTAQLILDSPFSRGIEELVQRLNLDENL